MIPLTIIGLFKMLLMIVGAFALLRFLGTLMIAKRDLDAQKQLKKQNEAIDRERNKKLKNFGKVTVQTKSKVSKNIPADDDTQDVEFEEI